MRVLKTLIASAMLVCFAAAALVAPLAIMATAAHAQEAVPDTTVDAASIFGAWRPYIVELASILIAAGVAFLADKYRQIMNRDLDAKNREALQAALENAAGLVISKAGDLTAAIKLDVRNPVLAEGIEYILKSAPDALKYFKLFDPAAIEEKLRAKIGVVAAAGTPLPSEPAPAGAVDPLTSLQR